jgi:hypothetical protein
MNRASLQRFLLAAALVCAALPAQAAVRCSADAAARTIELSAYATRIEAAAMTYAVSGIESSRALESAAAQLRERIAAMTPEDSAELCSTLASSPELAALPELLGETSALSAMAPSVSVPCVNLTRQQWDAAFATAQALRLAAIVATGICSGTGCLPLVCKVPCALKGVAEGAANVADAVIDRAAFCADARSQRELDTFAAATGTTLAGIGTRMDVVRPRVDVPLSTRATQGQVDALRARSDNGFNAIDARIESVRQSAVQNATRARQSSGNGRRQMTESALRTGFDAPVVSLLLPASRGGQIEAIREQVAETIGVYTGLGVDTTAARARFAAGDVALNAQRYREAYLAYRDAYRAVTTAATKPGEKP